MVEACMIDGRMYSKRKNNCSEVIKHIKNATRSAAMYLFY